MTEQTTVEEDRRLAELARSARRKGLMSLPLLIVGFAVAAVVARVVRSHEGKPQKPLLLPVLTLAGGVVLALALTWYLQHRYRDRPDAPNATMLARGLPRAQRRQVTRSIRAEQPSSDPVLRRVEVQSATGMVKLAKMQLVLLPVYALGVVVLVIYGRTPQLRLEEVLVGVLFTAATVVQVRTRRHARNFLDKAEGINQDSSRRAQMTSWPDTPTPT